MVKVIHVRYTTKSGKEGNAKYILPKKMQGASRGEITTYMHGIVKNWDKHNIMHGVIFGR
jgi:hypothetical protein